HHAIERIPAQDFDKPEIGQIAVEGGCRPAAAFLDRVHREFKSDATRVANPVAHPRGERDMDAVARREIAASLRDPDYWPPRLQLFPAQAIRAVSLDVNGGLARLGRVVKPDLAAQTLRNLRIGFAHGNPLWKHAHRKRRNPV